MTEQQVEAAAKAIRDEADKFSRPVRFYVQHEAEERYKKSNPEMDNPDVDWELESWKILARVALTAAERMP